MKKIMMILFVMLFFTGCSIEYNLIIDEDLKESFVISGSNYELYNIQKDSLKLPLNSEFKKLPDSATKEDYEKYELYDIKDKTKNKLYTLQYSYNFNVDNYFDSNAIRSCYEFFKVNNSGEQVEFSTSNSFNCFDIYTEIENVTINITSHYEVVQSNSDEVNGKTHSWYITKENAENKPIIFVYDRSKKNITTTDYFTGNYGVMFFIIGLILIGIIILIVKIKSNKVNKI